MLHLFFLVGSLTAARILKKLPQTSKIPSLLSAHAGISSLFSLFEKCVPLLHEIILFCKNTERRTRRYVNNSRNLPTSRTQRTQGRNIPFGGTPHSDEQKTAHLCFLMSWALLELSRGSLGALFELSWRSLGLSRAFRVVTAWHFR